MMGGGFEGLVSPLHQMGRQAVFDGGRGALQSEVLNTTSSSWYYSSGG